MFKAVPTNDNVNTARPLKRVVLREEFVVLTGHHERAIILAQFDYWAKRTYDFDKFIEEELQRQSNATSVDILEKTKTHGWIYKSAKDLLDETMLSVSEKTVRRHLVDLVVNGWLQERNNPKYKWDKTLQYRYNLHKVAFDLKKLNYEIQGWVLLPLDSLTVASKRQIVASEGQIVASEGQDVDAIPEITTENITETTTSLCHSTNDDKQKCSSYFPRLKGDKLAIFKEVISYLDEKNLVCKTLFEFVEQSPESVKSAYDEMVQRDKKHFSYFTKVFFSHLTKKKESGKHGKIDYENVDKDLYL